MGVQLFFVLSGFLITSILIGCRNDIVDQGRTRTGVLKAFYMRRVLRIFPIYYLTILVVFLVGSSGFREILPYHLFFVSNLPSAIYAGPLASGGLVHAQSSHFWSLAVEEQFYLFWPLLVLSMHRRSIVQLCLLLIVAAPLFRAALFLYGFPVQVGYLPAQMDALGIGALFAFYRGGWHPQIPPKAIRLILMICAGCMAICVYWYVSGVLYRPFWIIFPFFEAIAYLFLLAAVLNGKLPRLSRILRNIVLVTIGKVSFGVYLLHTFVASFVSVYIIDVSAQSVLLQALIGIVATVLVALLSWQFFERPINNLKARYPYKAQAA